MLIPASSDGDGNERFVPVKNWVKLAEIGPRRMATLMMLVVNMRVTMNDRRGPMLTLSRKAYLLSHPPVAIGHVPYVARIAVFRKFALMATMTVLSDISTAPIAGLRRIPKP